MKEESKNITLGLGCVSWNKELGPYYIDMCPAEVHYTSNLYGGGFDKNGVPMTMAKNAPQYFITNIAQYCFILHAQYCAQKDESKHENLRNCMAVLEQEKIEDGDNAYWAQKYYCERYHIPAPWVSSMAIGEAISIYLRMYQLENNPSYLQTAEKAYSFLKKTYEEGGVRRYDENGYLWFEEYPSNPPSYVLNGFIYTLFGLIDLYRVTQRLDVKSDIDECFKTLKDNLHRFDSGYWSNYDLRYKELVRYYYQKNVHVPQMEILYKLTGEPIFLHYKNKWEKNITALNYLFVKIMYRVRPRMQRLKKMLGI